MYCRWLINCLSAYLCGNCIHCQAYWGDKKLSKSQCKWYKKFIKASVCRRMHTSSEPRSWDSELLLSWLGTVQWVAVQRMRKGLICLVLNVSAHTKGTLSCGVPAFMLVFVWGSRCSAMVRPCWDQWDCWFPVSWDGSRRTVKVVVTGNWVGVGLIRKWY